MVTLPTPPFAILAERNRHVRNLLRREFEKMGFLVETFALGREAGKKAVMVGDVLVLDLDSIDADLGQVVRWVYARKPSLPIVVRAHSLEEAEDCLRYGRSVFVSKDQDINHLLTTVCSMLGNSKKLKT